jgi:hypothetical protein
MTVVQRLLESVWRVFEARRTDKTILEGEDKTRIPTSDLIAKLLADDKEEWSTANRGRAVTYYWLRDNYGTYLSLQALCNGTVRCVDRNGTGIIADTASTSSRKPGSGTYRPPSSPMRPKHLVYPVYPVKVRNIREIGPIQHLV